MRILVKGLKIVKFFFPLNLEEKKEFGSSPLSSQHDLTLTDFGAVGHRISMNPLGTKPRGG